MDAFISEYLFKGIFALVTMSLFFLLIYLLFIVRPIILNIEVFYDPDSKEQSPYKHLNGKIMSVRDAKKKGLM
jgi:hypothetical protein